MESFFLFSNILLWVTTLILFGLIFLIYRQFGQVYLGTADGISRDGIPIGDSTPKIEDGYTYSGHKFTNKNLNNNKPTIMAFISPNCGACKELIPEWNKAYQKYKRDFNFVLMGIGSKEQFDDFFKDISLNGELVLDIRSNFLHDFRVRVTPFAFAISENQVIKGKGLCNNMTHIEQLISTVSGDYQTTIKGVS